MISITKIQVQGNMQVYDFTITWDVDSYKYVAVCDQSNGGLATEVTLSEPDENGNRLCRDLGDVRLNIFAIDFETTNIDPKIAHPVEVAIFDGTFGGVSLIKPPIPIPAETSAIHHITDIDVADADDWATTAVRLHERITLSGTPAILIAHNAKYEQAILGNLFSPDEVRWICTYKCALRIWPDAPNHKNETLRYWLGLQFLGRGWDQQAHSAKHDTEVTYQIFLKLKEKCTIDQMIEWSALPAILPKIMFGKHRGSKWSEVPTDYLTWILKQGDMDEDVKYNASLEMNNRRKNAASRSH